MATALNSKSVGSIVKLNVNGTSRNFIVVHQGLPSSVYDSSCNGTWLLMEDIYETRKWDSTDNDYANSDIHSYLNNTFVKLFDSNIRSVIKQAKIPYSKGTGTGSLANDSYVATGSSGLSAKVFLLSYSELGLSGYSYINVEGAALDYFKGTTLSARIAYLNGTAEYWWLRSMYTANSEYAVAIGTSGDSYNRTANYARGIRPALILPTTVLVDDSGNIITNSNPTTPGIPSLPSEIKGGNTITVSWTAASDSDGNLSGYQLAVSLDGGSWTQVYKGSSRSYDYTVPEGTETLAFRVRAYDSMSAYSSYATTATYAVSKVPLGYATIEGAWLPFLGNGYATIEGAWLPLSGKGFIVVDGSWVSMTTGSKIVDLPDGYVRLEYIESNGTQWIDTGYEPNQDTRVVMEFEILTAEMVFMFGVRKTTSAGQFAFYWDNQGNFRSRYNTSNIASAGTMSGRHVVDMNKNVVNIDGTITSHTYAAFQTNYNMYLFTCNTTGSVYSAHLSGRVYSCQIYDNGIIVRDFVPCTNASGVVGLWDKVNGVFYANSGTGTFIAGNLI